MMQRDKLKNGVTRHSLNQGLRRLQYFVALRLGLLPLVYLYIYVLRSLLSVIPGPGMTEFLQIGFESAHLLLWVLFLYGLKTAVGSTPFSSSPLCLRVVYVVTLIKMATLVFWMVSPTRNPWMVFGITAPSPLMSVILFMESGIKLLFLLALLQTAARYDRDLFRHRLVGRAHLLALGAVSLLFWIWPLARGWLFQWLMDAVVTTADRSNVISIYIQSRLIVDASLMLIFPVWIWLLLRRARKRLPEDSSCFMCGYDLAGNSSGVCPECGLIMGADQAALEPA